jgi:hypothetical protein
MAGFDQQQKEWFSRAFLMAVSAAAGFTVQPQQDDIHGVDVVVRNEGISVDFQLKATAVPEYGVRSEDGADCLKFDLDVPTYDKLRGTHQAPRTAPGYIMVAVLPPKKVDWLAHRDGHMRLHRTAYWLGLTGMPETTNTTKVRLYLPLSNVVTASALQEIMQQAHERALRA